MKVEIRHSFGEVSPQWSSQKSCLDLLELLLNYSLKDFFSDYLKIEPYGTEMFKTNRFRIIKHSKLSPIFS